MTLDPDRELQRIHSIIICHIKRLETLISELITLNIAELIKNITISIIEYFISQTDVTFTIMSRTRRRNV